MAENNISIASEDGVNVTKLFTQEEIRKILKKVKVPLDGGIFPTAASEKAKYTMKIHDNIGIVINNESLNDTTVIKQDGSVINVGSWH